LTSGHGPFSHSFEQVLSGYDWAPRHEDWTKTIISHKDSDIRRQLEKNCITIDAVSSVFDKKSPCLLARPYQQIVSSQLDVDQRDYLIRDSHFSGVAIGRFDVHYLI
jgi:HD superfamily phosphohydrolase